MTDFSEMGSENEGMLVKETILRSFSGLERRLSSHPGD